MKKIVVNFLLFLTGAIMTYEFYAILTQGKIYPIPNIPTFVVYSVLILGVMIFAFFALWTDSRTKSFHEIIPSALLFSFGGAGSLLVHTIFPIIFLAHGWPINSYYGHEPNTVIALGELSLGTSMSLYGLFECFRRTKKSSLD